jgi:hypothetical protein
VIKSPVFLTPESSNAKLSEKSAVKGFNELSSANSGLIE